MRHPCAPSGDGQPALTQHPPNDSPADGPDRGPSDRLSASRLFACYERAGFIYAKKRERLLPVWPRVFETWDALLASPDGDPLDLRHCGDPAGERFAVGCSVRCGNAGLAGQHWAGHGLPLGIGELSLAVTRAALERAGIESFQVWYRAENRLPARVFGRAAAAAGSQGGNRTQVLFAWPEPVEPRGDVGCRLPGGAETRGVQVDRWTPARRWDAYELAATRGGWLWASVCELHTGDAEWAACASIYQRLGLVYDRPVLVARNDAGRVVGLAMVHRGPIGLNFTLLENRVELCLAPDVAGLAASSVARTLLAAARPLVRAEVAALAPIVVGDRDAAAVEALGAERYRTYRQSMWLGKAGIAALVRSLEQTYGAVLRRREVGGAP
ncbi:MAG: hypothetical protein R3F56_15730 [Planctomycetota bacterium]